MGEMNSSIVISLDPLKPPGPPDWYDEGEVDVSSCYATNHPPVPGQDWTEPKLPKKLKQLDTASASGDLDTVKSIFQSVFQTKLSTEEYPAKFLLGSLSEALKNDHYSVASYLLSQGAPFTVRHFVYVVEKKSYPLMQLFLDNGLDINTPVDASAPPALALNVVLNDENLIRWFLAHGADPNAGCCVDITPLSIAVEKATFSIIKLLFDNGGSIEHGQPLIFAVRRDEPDYLDVIQFICDKGVPINHVMYQSHMHSYLFHRAVGVGTPLHEAAARGKLDVVDFLLERGADPLIPDARGKLAIERAERHGHTDVVERLRPLSVPPAVRPHYFTDGRRVPGC